LCHLISREQISFIEYGWYKLVKIEIKGVKKCENSVQNFYIKLSRQKFQNNFVLSAIIFGLMIETNIKIVEFVYCLECMNDIIYL